MNYLKLYGYGLCISVIIGGSINGFYSIRKLTKIMEKRTKKINIFDLINVLFEIIEGVCYGAVGYILLPLLPCIWYQLTK